MSLSLYWLQAGGCGGDTMSLLSAESPALPNLLELLDIDLLWHPTLTSISSSEHFALTQRIVQGDRKLDILCVEGSVVCGPGGTGMYSTICGKPKKDLIYKLVQSARVVIALGTCASFGGIAADGEVDGTGLQFHKWDKGGFLGKEFIAQGGLPVINLPGCPCHGDIIGGVLSALAAGAPIPLNEYSMPLEYYGMLVHQGCTRNEYHEYRVEENNFGEKGCLFFHLGCHGPLAYGACNKMLWNGRNSKTRVGVPCFGCTRPDFPQTYPFFQTRNIEGIPLELPDGVDRAHYLAYKGIAAAAAPLRLKLRKTWV